MKDKFFDKPQYFDAEDEAFFNKHYGKQKINNESTPNKANQPVNGINESAQGTVIIDPETNELKIVENDLNDSDLDQIINNSNVNEPSTLPQRTNTTRQRRRIPVEEARAQLAQKQNSLSENSQKINNNTNINSSASNVDNSEQPVRRRRNINEIQNSEIEHRQEVRYSPGTTRQESVLYGNETDDEPKKRKNKKKKKHHWILKLILIFLLFIALIFIFKKQPVTETEGLGERTDGISTILLAGVDKDEYRTDTLMLLSIDNNNHTMSLMSIPRDTYLENSYGYNVPKINSAYGFGGGDKGGIEELMNQVENIIGFKPDGYIMFDFDDFVDVVNLMGGVDFDVPMDMQYSDPTQNLEINLSAGEQHLNGKEAIQLVRFRSGYANADITRTEVQRDFIKAAIEQWTTPLNIIKLPLLMIMIKNKIDTDLSMRNLAWLATAGIKCDLSNLNTQILPGSAQYIGDGSYYVADSSSVRTLMINSFSPYKNM